MAFTLNAAIPATNVVTLVWTAPVANGVPFLYEMHQSTDLIAWSVIASNIPPATTNITLNVDKVQKFWKIRSVCSTNTAWVSDFSNVAQTIWPPQSDLLSIRLGQ